MLGLLEVAFGPVHHAKVLAEVSLAPALAEDAVVRRALAGLVRAPRLRRHGAVLVKELRERVHLAAARLKGTLLVGAEHRLRAGVDHRRGLVVLHLFLVNVYILLYTGVYVYINSYIATDSITIIQNSSPSFFHIDIRKKTAFLHLMGFSREKSCLIDII